MRFAQTLRALSRDERGATAVEYGLIVSLIVIAVIGAMNALASETTSMWVTITEMISAVM